MKPTTLLGAAKKRWREHHAIGTMRCKRGQDFQP
jgi:hypothetical protein